MRRLRYGDMGMRRLVSIEKPYKRHPYAACNRPVTGSEVKQKVNHVSILHHVFSSFDAQTTTMARFGK